MMSEQTPDVAQELKNIIYRIEPEEVSLLAWQRHPLTKKEIKKLERLERRRKWKKLRRYRTKLDRQRDPAAQRVMTEWLVQELNPGNAEKDNIMVTKASGSQSTKTVPTAGQNKPLAGGAAGAGKARGTAALPTISRTNPAPTRKK